MSILSLPEPQILRLQAEENLLTAALNGGKIVIATMKRLWPNGFVWSTVPHDVQRLKAGLVAFRALEDYHARRLQ